MLYWWSLSAIYQGSRVQYKISTNLRVSCKCRIQFLLKILLKGVRKVFIVRRFPWVCDRVCCFLLNFGLLNLLLLGIYFIGYRSMLFLILSSCLLGLQDLNTFGLNMDCTVWEPSLFLFQPFNCLKFIFHNLLKSNLRLLEKLQYLTLEFQI